MVKGTFQGWRILFLSLVTVGIFGSVCSAEEASPLSAPPPAVYNERLLKMLTPLEDVLKKKADYAHFGENQDGITLLDETITFVNADGTRVSVYHTIYKALNASGAKSLGDSSFYFKKKAQKVYLPVARTIQDDGSKFNVTPDAVFVKTPQDESGDSIYDDEQELVAIYPNVKPGSITESVTVLEDVEAKIPNEFSEVCTWVAGWPEYRQKFILDVPDAFIDRLKITNIGQGVPSFSRQDLPSHRHQLLWEAFRAAADREDSTEAPAYQIGPLVWISTLKDWDAFAKWYNGLTKGTDKLCPELKAKVDAWTQHATDPEKILDILYDHVATDVRYTGIELGKSDIQPHDCNSVWSQQYGDCKDKANLLRAMLAYKGIPSYLTLLQTEHAGVINKANPDHRQFDHCITYVKLGDKTLFCDPTISGGVPGLVGGGTADRDVLVIKDDHALWEHTPPFSGASIDYGFDLDLHSSGELSGWVTILFKGYYGASYKKHYLDFSKEDALSHLQEELRGFFPNASVVDLQFQDALPRDPATPDLPAPFAVKAFMTLPGVLNPGDESAQLKFPSPDELLPSFQDYKLRNHTTFMWTDNGSAHVSIKLPQGWTCPSLPPAFTQDSPLGTMEASWSKEPGLLKANLSIAIKKSLYQPDEWKTLGVNATDLDSWSSKSITILNQPASSDEIVSIPKIKTDSDVVSDMAIMPTGEGQLTLIDNDFPDDGNVGVRRAALARIATLFPTDKKARFEASVRLASLDLSDKKFAAVINRLSPLEDAYRATLDETTLAWGNYIIGLALKGAGKEDDALGLLKSIADDENVEPYRRGWAVYQAAQLIAKKSPVAGLDYADKGLKFESDAVGPLYAFYASTAIKNGQEARLKDRLRDLISSKPQGLTDTLQCLLDADKVLMDDGERENGLKMVAVLESVSDEAITGDSFNRSLKELRGKAEASDTYTKIQSDLKQLLTQFPDVAALEKKQPSFASVDDAAKSASQHEDKSEPDDALGCELRLAIGYPAGKETLDYVWSCVRYAEWGLRNDKSVVKQPFFDKLSQLTEELPHNCDAYTDSLLLEAKVKEDNNDREGAGKIFDSLFNATDLSDGYAGAITLRRGKNFEAQGQYDKALENYKRAETILDDDAKAQEAVLRAAFINFDNGQNAEALRLVKLLGGESRRGKLRDSEQIKDVLLLVGDGSGETPELSAPPAMWQNWHSWWADWQKIEEAAQVKPQQNKKVIPIIPSMETLGEELGTARRDKDVEKAFQLLQKVAYAARFYPNAVTELASAMPIAEEMLPAQAFEMRRLSIDLLEPLKPVSKPMAISRLVLLAANYVDTNQSDKALALAENEWSFSLEDKTPGAYAMHRVWALAAIDKHKDLERMRDALVEDLKDSSFTTDRFRSVKILADVYHSLHQTSEAVALLKTELKNPAIASDADIVKSITDQLGTLQTGTQSSADLVDGVNVWLQTNKPAWWDYAAPHDLSDPIFDKLPYLLRNAQRTHFQTCDPLIPNASVIKAALMAPGLDSLNRDEQLKYVVEAFQGMIDCTHTETDADALVDSFIVNAYFPNSIKLQILSAALVDAIDTRHTQRFDNLMKLPLADSIPESQRHFFVSTINYLKADRSSVSDIKSYLNTLKQGLIGDLNFATAGVALSDLAQLGEFDEVNNWISQMTDDGSSDPIMKKCLALLRQSVSEGQSHRELVEGIRKAISDSHLLDSVTKPADFEERRDFDSFNDLSSENAAALSLYLVKVHREPNRLNFWSDLAIDLRLRKECWPLNQEICRLLLEHADGDPARAQAIRYTFAAFDTDDPEQRKIVYGLIDPYRDNQDNPFTSEEIRLHELQLTLRDGKPVNFAVDFSGFQQPGDALLARIFKLHTLLISKNADRDELLKSELDWSAANPGTAIFNEDNILRGEELLHLDTEAAEARAKVEMIVKHDVLQVWLTHAHHVNWLIPHLSALDSASSIPPAFLRSLDEIVADNTDKYEFKEWLAFLNHDWKGVVENGKYVAYHYPTLYSQYYPLGKAYYELGELPKAKENLELYCQYGVSEFYFDEAKTILEELKSRKVAQSTDAQAAPQAVASEAKPHETPLPSAVPVVIEESVIATPVPRANPASHENPTVWKPQHSVSGTLAKPLPSPSPTPIPNASGPD